MKWMGKQKGDIMAGETKREWSVSINTKGKEWMRKHKRNEMDGGTQ